MFSPGKSFNFIVFNSVFVSSKASYESEKQTVTVAMKISGPEAVIGKYLKTFARSSWCKVFLNNCPL